MLIILVLAILTTCNASRILLVLPTPSYSHQVVFQPIWRELALKGHEVTVVTTNPLNIENLANLREINLHYIYSLIEDKYKFSKTLDSLKDQPLKFATYFLNTLSAVNEDELSDPQVQKLIHDPNEKFDLVMVEYLLPTMLAFGHRFNCPVIAITSLDGTLNGHDIMGNPSHPALNPDSVLMFNVELTFMQRVISTIYSVARRLSLVFVLNQQDQVIQKHFGPDYPPLEEMLRKVDMFFMNVNPAFHNVRPTVPAVINIGGNMNLRDAKPLSKEIKTIIDTAKEGVIYFSMGTNVRTTTLSDHFIKALLKAFSELPYEILWKLDQSDLPGKSDNVHMFSWCPQQDILRHPNVKVFMTQGGLQSLEEAINLIKPVVCIPFFGDQFSNCIKARDKGMGLLMDHHTADSEIIKQTILNIVGNKTYIENLEKLAVISTDQPMTGVEKAVWWSEYVIRHKGAKHLRSPAADMPLYQYFLVDVLAFITAVLALAAYILTKLTKLICCKLCFKKKQSNVKKVKMN